jgi:peptide deformylase
MQSEAKPIVQLGDKGGAVLKRVSDPVPLKDISTNKIKRILKEMSATLALEEDGVALAAPQIGESLRIFIVKGSVLAKPGDDPLTIPDAIFINPVITKRSRDVEWMDEGCLSVKNFYGKTKRSLKATVRAYNEHGKLIVRGAAGLLAQIFQHETDHLNGVLFIDHADDVVEVRPKKKRI